MPLFSTNYFWMRVVASLLLMLSSNAILALTLIVFEFEEYISIEIVIVYSALVGAFNVFEPKIVQEDYERIKKFWKDNFGDKSG